MKSCKEIATSQSGQSNFSKTKKVTMSINHKHKNICWLMIKTIPLFRPEVNKMADLISYLKGQTTVPSHTFNCKMWTKLCHWLKIRAKHFLTKMQKELSHHKTRYEKTRPKALWILNLRRGSGSRTLGNRVREALLMLFLTSILREKRARNNSSSHCSRKMIHLMICSSSLD